MKAVLLDRASLGDVSLSSLENVLPELQSYDSSTPSEILERCKDAEIILTNKCILDKETLQKFDKLKFIQVLATGTNIIDLEYAKEAGITVKNVEGYSSKSVATYILTSILNLLTSYPTYNRYVDDGKWQESPSFCYLGFPIESLEGKTVGIYGYGNIAKTVEAMIQPFGMKTMIAESHRKNPAEKRVPLTTLLKEVDILLISCPITKDTENSITKKELALMKPTSCVIVASRGGIVNEADLAHALDTGVIAGAAIDVLTKEPPRDNPLLSIKHDKLYITPHVAWASKAARKTLIQIVTENCKLLG